MLAQKKKVPSAVVPKPKPVLKRIVESKESVKDEKKLPKKIKKRAY